MRRSTRKVLAVAFVLLFAAAAAAQMPMQGPSISMHGFWSPVVGSGAAYSVEVKGQPKQEIEIGIVGSETVGGKPGYWLEMATREPRVGLMVVKTLVMLQAKDLQVQRTIVQSGDDPPIEFTTQMMPQQPEKQVADISEEAERVGTETITVPAGTFSCEHWRAGSATRCSPTASSRTSRPTPR
jgi:hypothetical protein